MCQLAGRGAPDLDDPVQLAAEQVFSSLASFGHRSDLMTWVYSICYRVLLRNRRFYRRFRLRFSLQDEEKLQAASDETATAALETWDRARRLHAALARLSDKYRAVVVLHDLEELPVRDIAGIVNAGELTVRSRLRDGRRQLKKILDEDTADASCGGQHELTPS